MAQQEIQAGDTVRLKSGGPIMTVLQADHPDTVDVSWFDDKKEVKYSSFPMHALNLVEI